MKHLNLLQDAPAGRSSISLVRMGGRTEIPEILAFFFPRLQQNLAAKSTLWDNSVSRVDSCRSSKIQRIQLAKEIGPRRRQGAKAPQRLHIFRRNQDLSRLEEASGRQHASGLKSIASDLCCLRHRDAFETDYWTG